MSRDRAPTKEAQPGTKPGASFSALRKEFPGGWAAVGMRGKAGASERGWNKMKSLVRHDRRGEKSDGRNCRPVFGVTLNTAIHGAILGVIGHRVRRCTCRRYILMVMMQHVTVAHLRPMTRCCLLVFGTCHGPVRQQP